MSENASIDARLPIGVAAHEIREGKAELIDGGEALERVRAGLKPNRRK